LGQYVRFTARHPNGLHNTILQLVCLQHSMCANLTGNSLAWFPTLFFTSVWVSEIYTSSVPSAGIDPKVFAADAVRAGNRALFLQAIVTIIVSIGAPFLVAESGIQVAFQQNEYQAVGGEGNAPTLGPGRRDTGRSGESIFNSRQGGEGVMGIVKSLAVGLIERAKSGTLFQVPIKGLTLVKLWSAAMFTFSIAMGMTW
jgi:solute carrier family 45 protein 1/2/4